MKSVPENSDRLPFSLTKITISDTGSLWQTEPWFQYFAVTAGAAVFLLAGHRVTLSAGEGLFLNNLQPYCLAAENTGEATLLRLSFSADIISADKTNRLYRNHVKPLLSSSAGQALLLHQADQEGLYLPEENNELELLAAAVRIFALTAPRLLAKGTDVLTEDSRKVRRLIQILQYIDQHYAEKITLDTIAEHAGFSRSECSRFFRDITGQNLFNYLIDYRIERSLALLSGTDMPVSAIASAAGFAGQSYYAKCFSERKGITPVEYRKRTRREV